MLTLTTPTSVRPIPEEATSDRHNRKPGAVGWLLDPAPIAGYIQGVLLREGDDRTIRIEESLLLRSPQGELAVIGTEGVGEPVPEDKGTITVYAAIGFIWEDIEIPHDVIQQAITGYGADVAGFIRTFGDRLDTNAYIWRQFVLAGN